MHIKLPDKLLSSLEGIKGFDKESFENLHRSREQIVSIRFNPSKTGAAHHPLATSRVPWSSQGYYLSERPPFTLDPMIHAGVYYVQEASSMFLEEVFRQTVDLTNPLRVLDLCAAPGGKSTLIQTLISADSLLVSNEVIKTRVGVLYENMTKWGGENVVITCNDPKDFSRLENYFDVIVIDAPCSGSGLFRRDQKAIKEWSEENVMLCAHRQQRILADALPALKKEGVLIYSTCSYSKQEDEDLLDWVTKTFDLATVRLDLDENWSIVETISDKYGSYGYRFYPDKLKGEGFFIAALRKRGGEDFYQPKNKRSTLERLTKKDESLTKSWIRQDARAVQIKFENLVHAIPEPLWNDFIFLKSSVYIKKAGVLLGKLAPNDLIPDHELALSKLFNEDVHSIELSIDQALDYLRKEDLKVDLDRKGWFLVKYENQNLGWLKALPNRINNYYPADWRIKKR